MISDIAVRLLRGQVPPHSSRKGFRGGCEVWIGFFYNDWRGHLGTAVLTMGSGGVAEGADQVHHQDACDLWPKHDAGAGYAQFEGEYAITAKHMKDISAQARVS